MKTMILAAVLAVALMLAGCGGGSKGGSVAGIPSGGGTPTPTTPTPTPEPTRTYGPGTVPLPTGHTLETGTLPVGRSRTVGEADGMETVIRCTAGSENCRFTVAADGTVTLIAGSLRIEIVGIRVTPTTPTPTTPTPPTPVVETPLITWRELPTLVDRMTHRTELRSRSFAGPSCDDGVTACQAVVKTLLANATENRREEFSSLSFAGRVKKSAPMRWFSGRRTFEIEYTYNGVTYPRDVTEYFYGAWLDNSIFIASDGPILHPYSSEADAYFGRAAGARYLSMGIRDTDPVTGVYRGLSVTNGNNNGTFELNYTSSATGGQLDMTLRNHIHNTYTWMNVSVDNEGYFDNDITKSDGVLGANKLEGRFYQGGEVGGVYSYRLGQNPNADLFGYGAFGGKLGWSLPAD